MHQHLSRVKKNELSELSECRDAIVDRDVPESLFTDSPGLSIEATLRIRYNRDLRLPDVQLTLYPPRCHSNSDIKRILRANRTRDVLAHDIKRSPVRRRRDHHGQPALDGDAAVEAQQLHRYLALVVVHGDDAVVVLPLQEDGVAGEGALDSDPLFLGCFHRGPDVVDLVAPEVAAFAVVGV